MSDAELMCANCGQALDPGDMFCRACGLPTVRAYASRAQAVEAAPDLHELERSLEIAPEPAVLERISSVAADDTEPLDRVAFAAPARALPRLASPLTIVLLVALLGAVVVFLLLLTLG